MILPDEIVLLTLDDASGKALGRQGMAADLALAGAVLMELSLANRVDNDGHRLVLHSGVPTGEPVLNDSLRLLGLETPADSRAALMLLLREAASRRAAVLERLVQTGLLRRDRGGFLRLFGTRYPKQPGRAETAEIRTRLRALALGDALPEPRDCLAFGLVRAAGLIRLLFDEAELDQVRDRVGLLIGMEALNRSLGAVIADIQGRRLRAATG